MSRAAQPRGYLMLMALVFGSIFLGLLAALSSYVLSENHAEVVSISKSKALAIAEAGLEYYRWHLAHFPTDLQNGTGQPGPYTIPYNDPEGGQTGSIQLSITGNQACGQITSIDIQSKGMSSDGAGGTATLDARYAKPSVALYSYILNSSVWAGADRIINGPYHSNGGIHMDGTVNAPVTSSLSSWTCTTSFGCNSNMTEPGVFGSGTNSTLWSYPTPQVDFSAISADFSSLKTTAKASGLYFPRISSGTSGSNAGEGYHLIFNSNGTVTVYKVTAETNVPSLPIDNQSQTTVQPDYTLIKTQSLYNDGSHSNGVYTIPSGCGLVFVEDNTWIEGTIPSEITLVAANVTNTGVTPNIMLPNNITYSNPSGTSGLTAISSNDILITPNSPQNMTLNGIFIAQGGAFGRNYYGENSSGQMTCPNTYEPRGTLTIHGTTVSNLRTGTQWENGCSTGNAGYQSRIDAFDRQLSTNPPPFTPFVSTTYEFVNWRQE
ncbi:MAG: hypothetical protein P4M11_06205 [Candidatus Pacebacteria bacterium]|nr:hypothetical protein [Candidatus Paceibacterota bacterium]